MISPRTMPGVLELLPAEQIAFQRMLEVVRHGFERYGFLPIETPAIEFSEILLTKTGGETERQVYFVQSTGALEKSTTVTPEPVGLGMAVPPATAPGGSGAGESDAAAGTDPPPATPTPELALRFDLTVPLARYVAEHEHQLNFPFRRYQIQRVYRGESPQRGRFREFYQCDIDVVGRDTLDIRHDAEIPAVISTVFEELGIGPFTIRLNNRKLMHGLLDSWGVPAQHHGVFLREIDKLEKRGVEAVAASLDAVENGPSLDTLTRGLRGLRRSESHEDALGMLDALADGSPGAGPSLESGIEELRVVLETIRHLGVPEQRYCLDLAIARGLDYYTGTVYETTLDAHPEIGSICSGGRYDDLASHYTDSRLPGVGISIGLTRLFWQLRERGLVPTAGTSADVLITLMDDDGLGEALGLATVLRAAGLRVESVLAASRLGKQIKYADRAGIRFAVIAGSDERSRGVVTVKDLTAQTQQEVAPEDLVAVLTRSDNVE
jgi:histidyl-tRNA synthetase